MRRLSKSLKLVFGYGMVKFGKRGLRLAMALAMVLTGFNMVAVPVSAADATVNINTDSIVVDNYMGIGVQWDPSDIFDYTTTEWNKYLSRVGYMKPQFVRCILHDADSYCTGYDGSGNPTYNWNAPIMTRAYKILDYCQANGIDVILGEWNDPAARGAITQYNIQEDDPRWARLIGDCLNYLINTKGYTCIKYYNYVNEPNGSWSYCADFTKWKTGIGNLKTELVNRGLDSKVKIMGPDNSGNNEWVDYTAQQIPDKIGLYDTHWYAEDYEVAGGNIESAMAAKRSLITATDPNGGSKNYIMGEAGLMTGRTNGDQQPNTKVFWYGVSMADYIAQTMRAGMAGASAWMLEDSMHLNGDVPSNHMPTGTSSDYNLKIWGFWNAIGTRMGAPSDENLRPWFYTWSLLSREFPKGSTIVNAGSTGLSGVRVVAAKKVNGSNYDMSIAVVNNSDTARTIRVAVPNATSTATLKQFNYFSTDMPVDSNGFPVVKQTLSGVSLSSGIDVSLPSKGVVILTTMEGGTPVSLAASGNLALKKPVTVSSTETGGNVAANAVDGNTGTRWSSAYSDPQWIYADLGSSKTVGSVKLNWEAAYAKTYKIQVSNDASTWTDVYSTSSGAGGIETISFTPVSARYVRMYGTQRATQYGYSLYEFEVYANGSSGTANTDYLNDWSKAYSHTANWAFDSTNASTYFEGDTSRIKRTTDTAENVVYNYSNITNFSAKVYYWTSISGKVKVYTSPNNSTWTLLSITNDTPVATSGTWYRTNFTPSGSIPAGTNYIKIEFSSDSNIWTPQLSQVSITHN